MREARTPARSDLPVLTLDVVDDGGRRPAQQRGHDQADAFAARHASPAELIAALVALYRDNAATLTPDPLHSRFYDSHPPASLRIAHLKELSA